MSRCTSIVMVGVIFAASTSSAWAQCSLQLAPPQLWIAQSPAAVVAADFNHDGRADVASVSSTSGLVTVVFGNGVGGFSSGSAFTVAGSCTHVAAGDVNNDGDIDLVVGQTAGGLQVLLGNGSGGFSVQGAFTPPGATTIRQVAIGDINGDNNPDLAAALGSNGSVVYYQGVGNGQFVLPIIRASAGAHVQGVAILDLNRDGFKDLVHTTSGALGSSPNRLRVHYGVSGGGISPTVTDLGIGGGEWITVADVNQDGQQDLVAPQLQNTSINLHLLFADGSKQTSLLATSDAFVANGVAVADFNGDGNNDILYPASAAGGLKLAYGIGGGNFDFPHSQVATQNPVPDSVCAVDLNGDNRVDIAAPIRGTQSGIAVFRNTTTTSPVITSQPQNAAGAPLSSVTLQVVATNAGSYQWRRNNIPIPDGGHYAGASTAMLTITQLTGIEVGSYTCVINAPLPGCPLTVSNAAEVSLLPACDADFNSDGLIDFFDYLDFVAAFSTGC